MKRIILPLFLATVLSASAQSVADMWIAMPDSMAPYLSKNDRKEMVECLKIGVDTSVKNKFNGTTDFITLNDDYARITLSEAKDLQIVRLPETILRKEQSDSESSDSIFLAIETLRMPQPASTLRFFDSNWNEIPSANRLVLESMAAGDQALDECQEIFSFARNYDNVFSASDFIIKPDTISTETYKELCSLVSFFTLECEWDNDMKLLSIVPHFPFLSEDEKKRLKPFLCKKVLNLVDKMFINVIYQENFYKN